MNKENQDMPLVSVIIPSYRQAHYLTEAIQSVVNQDYRNHEIIVVNDGSDDNTAEVVKQFEHVVYVYQQNLGLSAARNTGILHAKGRYLIFLDADDVLVEHAIQKQVDIMLRNPELAFVSGSHFKADRELKMLVEDKCEINHDHYLHLLEGNYIGMHAAVMYDRRVFDEFRFDTSLKAVEDYDLYLAIAARYPVMHHTMPLAIYRKHGENMSHDTPMMLSIVLKVLRKHGAGLCNAREKHAYRLGLQNWVNYYCDEMYRFLVERGKNNPAIRKKMLAALIRYKPKLYLKYRLFN